MAASTGPIQEPWRITADTVPEMAYDSYRDAMIHETSNIKSYLVSRHSQRTVLVAPKGYGKTLLLIAKKKSFLDSRSKPNEIIMAETVFIDRPNGAFPVYSRATIDSLANDYQFWKTAWKISIALSAVKAFARAKRDFTASQAFSHSWFKNIFDDGRNYFEGGEIFTLLINMQYADILDIYKHSNVVFSLLSRVNTSVIFFIDNVDQFFEPVLEDRSFTTNVDTRHRNRSNTIWMLAQIALASAAYELEKANPHIKVFCTMRQEAFLRMADVESDAFQISSKCLQIQYSAKDLEDIFIKNIEMTPDSDLVEPASTDLISRFVGSLNKIIRHRFVDKSEPLFRLLLRHTLSRPRDLMYLGAAINGIAPADRSAASIQQAVDAATNEIVTSIFGEMRPFFAVPVRRFLLKHIPSNVLTLQQLEDVRAQYLGERGTQSGVSPSDEVMHPFCVLHKLGLLGTLRLKFEEQETWEQAFVQPTQIRVNNETGLPHSHYYLIHPALDQSVYERTGGRFAQWYERKNIIGDRLGWEEPITYSFVLKGDMIGYSTLMNTEMYEIATQKLHEWSAIVCKDLAYADVSGGDSIMLIDSNPVKLLQCARQFMKFAKDFRERPMKFRFGGAAGPIQFRKLRRMQGGIWNEFMVPMGLALRTSARLEPFAEDGYILVEEVFSEFGRQRTAQPEDHSLALSTFNDGLPVDSFIEINEGDLSLLKYDSIRGQFCIQKNSEDPPYYTRLWKISVS